MDNPQPSPTGSVMLLKGAVHRLNVGGFRVTRGLRYSRAQRESAACREEPAIRFGESSVRREKAQPPFSLDSRARLKLKGIDGRAPPGVEPAA